MGMGFRDEIVAIHEAVPSRIAIHTDSVPWFSTYIMENWTTGPEAHLVMADRPVSRLGFNQYPWSSYTELVQYLGVEFIGLVHLVHAVLHPQSTEHERYSFKSRVYARSGHRFCLA